MKKSVKFLVVVFLFSCITQPAIANDSDFVDPSLQKTVRLSARSHRPSSESVEYSYEYWPAKEYLWAQLNSCIRKEALGEVSNEDGGISIPATLFRPNNPDIAFIKIQNNSQTTHRDDLNLISIYATIQFRHNGCVQKRYGVNTFNKTYDTSDVIFDCDGNVHRLFAEVKKYEHAASSSETSIDASN